MPPPVAFIIGAGWNVGRSVASTLKGLGYKIALGSRSPPGFTGDFLYVRMDATKPDDVAEAFDKVTKELGPPHVVIFNPCTFQPIPRPGDPLSLSRPAFERHIAIGTAVFDSAQHALAGFRKLGPGTPGSPRTFIVTGNIAPFSWSCLLSRIKKRASSGLPRLAFAV
ncbi:hypothetical protein FA95DRAFT_1556805 [Auriscalpium vulgare]|uniref:Uncharacterized protein n=1 Tax=Auriscalpium vulgare TaxID=40419 RepID=A0ACB8S086_9AGAM|nr:hypothetical protein FA95DRAFT_1556805 [Auriscalpium vulgare]